MTGGRRVWQRVLMDPAALVVMAACLGLFLSGMRDIGGWFFPYRWWFIGAIAVAILSAAARVRWIVYRGEHYFLYAMMAIAALSCVVSPMPEYSFARLATFILMFFAVFVAGWAWLQDLRNLTLVVWLLAATAVLGALASVYYLLNEQGLIPTGRVAGAFGKATGTGSFAAASLPLVLWKWQYSRGKWRLFFGLILGVLAYLLVFSGARAALVGGTAATAVWLWKHYRLLRPAIIGGGFVAAGLALGGVLSLDMLPEYIVRKQSLTTFTGRIPRWQVGWDLFLQSPVIGHGYGMTRYIRLSEDGERLQGQLVPGEFNLADLLPGSGRLRLGRMTLHSDHIERLVETGIVGFLPFAGFWFCLMRRVARVFLLPPDASRSLAMALGLYVCYLFLDSFMHGALFAVNAPGATLQWLVIAVFMAASEVAGLARPSDNAHPARHS
ncbi:MAG: O-antigen ligase family protein [Bryobacteraceae bacterium]